MLWAELNMRLRRDDWLEMGFEVLREQGAGALTIDRLTERLGVTKGSFYHHFANREEYSVALLEEWERRLTGELIEASRRGRGFDERNRRLTRGGLEHFDPPLEMAIRAWALQDPIAREVQERVDRRRFAYLHELFGLLTENSDLAEELALIRYSFAVGAQQLLPPMDQPTYARLFGRLEQQLEDAARMSRMPRGDEK
jgi:AcrR family transcriptional regulator